MAIAFMLAVLPALAQLSNPTPFDLSTGNYLFNTWAATNAAGTYPANMIFHRHTSNDPRLADEVTIDYTLAYNLTSGPRINGLGADSGLAFSNSGTSNNYVGAVVVALNATGRSNISVSYLAQLLTEGDGNGTQANRREWAFRLQYRVGNTGTWLNVLNSLGNPVEYSSVGLRTTPTIPAAQTVGPVVLPSDANNQSLVQVRIKFYFSNDPAQTPAPAGTRPRMRLDDISITSQSSSGIPSKFAITSIIPSVVSATSTFTAVVQAQDALNASVNVTQATPFNLTVASGTGVLSGTVSGTLAANTNSITITGIRYTTVENNVQIRATGTGSGIALAPGTSAPFNVAPGATTIAIANLINQVNAGKVIRTFTVTATRPDASTDTNYNGSVTITRSSGPGTIGGTLVRAFVKGIASFNDISFSDSGTYVLNVAATDLPSLNRTVQVFPPLSLTELFVPQFMKSLSNTTRVPVWALVRINNLLPGTQYRYMVGGVNSPTAIGQGAGNNFHFDENTGNYNYAFPNSLTSALVPPAYSTFTTKAGETSRTMWVSLVPTGNTVFANGNTVIWRISLTDQPVPGVAADILQTTSTTRTLEFGPFSTDATGIFDSQSGLPQKTFVVLFDNITGTGSPLATAIVQDEGATSTANTFAPYFAALESTNGSWATLIPSGLVSGVRRLEHRDANGNLIKVWTDEDGIWAGVSTVQQTGGINAIDFRTPQIQLTSPTAAQRLCVGKPFTITWTSRGVDKVNLEYTTGYSTGSTPFVIQNNANAASGSFTWIPNDFKDSSTNASIRITDAEHNTATGTVSPISVFLPPIISLQPRSKNTCQGDTVYLISVANGTGVRYQWYRDGRPIPNETRPTLMLPNVTPGESGLYRCFMTGLAPCSDVFSDTAVIYVNRPLLVLRQPENRIVTRGSSASFEVAANGNFTVNYQWFRGTRALTDDLRISGANGPVLTIRNVDSTDIGNDYSCRIIGPGNCGSVISQNASLQILGVSITASPADVQICNGDSAVFTANARVIPAGTDLVYRWYRNGRLLQDGARIAGTTTSRLIIRNCTVADTGSYSLQVEATGPISGTAAAFTAPATLRIIPAPAITVQPDSALTVCPGAPIPLSTTVTGSNLSYQWYQNGISISGQTAPALNLTMRRDTVTANDVVINYYCVVSSACGKDTTRISRVRVPALTKITTDLRANYTIRLGDTLRIGIVNTGGAVRYQWLKDGVALNGEVNPNFAIVNARRSDAGKYICIITGECDTVRSVEATVVVNGPAGINDDATMQGYSLEQSIPNPATDKATIRFSVPHATKANLQITDLLGRTLISADAGMVQPGLHEYTFNVENLNSGMYYYTLTTPQGTLTRAMQIIH
jgi:hypothetical protein